MSLPQSHTKIKAKCISQCRVSSLLGRRPQEIERTHSKRTTFDFLGDPNCRLWAEAARIQLVSSLSSNQVLHQPGSGKQEGNGSPGDASPASPAPGRCSTRGGPCCVWHSIRTRADVTDRGGGTGVGSEGRRFKGLTKGSFRDPTHWFPGRSRSLTQV